jgi:hypothetical protein
VGIVWSVIGILISGAAGGLAGWWVAATLALPGAAGAIVAAVIGMVVATGVWIALTVGLRRLGLLR